MYCFDGASPAAAGPLQCLSCVPHPLTTTANVGPPSVITPPPTWHVTFVTCFGLVLGLLWRAVVSMGDRHGRSGSKRELRPT